MFAAEPLGDFAGASVEFLGKLLFGIAGLTHQLFNTGGNLYRHASLKLNLKRNLSHEILQTIVIILHTVENLDYITQHK